MPNTEEYHEEEEEEEEDEERNREVSSASEEEEYDTRKITCDVLCSLGATAVKACKTSCPGRDEPPKRRSSKTSATTCPKQLQLPLFLTKTYHMIDRCDPDISTWSENGDNFVVKNVEKFAKCVLPLYFKHSNFSSFARQLNFYGFRKLRSDPILTSDVDPNTINYVRFYHEKFQKDRPELLHEIKRATKTDQQSKDDVDALRHEMHQLRETLAATTADYDRKLAELSYECNRRITAMNVEFDKLAAVVQQMVGSSERNSSAMRTNAAAANSTSTAPSSSMTLASAIAAAAVAGASSSSPSTAQTPDLLHSLSQAAVTLQQHSTNNNHHHSNGNDCRGVFRGKKREAPPDDATGTTEMYFQSPTSSRLRYG